MPLNNQHPIYIKLGGFITEVAVRPRAENVVERRVPLPDGWQHAVAATALPEIAKESARRVHARDPALRPGCRVLGVPKFVHLRDDRAARVPGGVVALKCAVGRRQEFILCAHVSGSKWWCHAGTSPDGGRVFDPADLQLADVDATAWNAGAPYSHKRLRGRVATQHPRELAQSHPCDFASTVAVAGWKAEGLRAHLEKRPLDIDVAGAAFESNPFLWHAWSERQDYAYVWSEWSWASSRDACGSGDRACDLSSARLDHLLDKRRPGVPVPSAFAEAHLLEKLLGAAKQEIETTKAPCIYLGFKIGDHFEQEPCRWPADLLPSGEKAEANVWFEFPYVFRGDFGENLHRVSIQARHILHHGRNVPGNPLRDSTPLGLTFTVQFLDAVAENVSPKAQYKGISYEAGRPDLEIAVPNGGHDIQDESVYWVLPGGRCVCKSMRSFAQLPAADLEEASTLEAYEAAAEELDYYFLGVGPDAQVDEFREVPGSGWPCVAFLCSQISHAMSSVPCQQIAMPGQLGQFSPSLQLFRVRMPRPSQVFQFNCPGRAGSPRRSARPICWPRRAMQGTRVSRATASVPLSCVGCDLGS